MDSLWSGSRIKFEFDKTFVRLPSDFFFVLKIVGSGRNRLNASPNFCSTFVSFNTGRLNVGQMSKPFKQAFKCDIRPFQIAIVSRPRFTQPSHVNFTAIQNLELVYKEYFVFCKVASVRSVPY